MPDDDPVSPSSVTAAASATRALGGLTTLARNRLPRMNELLQTVEGSPHDFQARYDLAAFLENFARDARQAATEQLRMAIRLAPHDPRLRYELGIHQLENLGSPEEAASTLIGVLQSGSVPPWLEPMARYYLARAHYALGRRSEALAELQWCRKSARARGDSVWEGLLDDQLTAWSSAPAPPGSDAAPGTNSSAPSAGPGASR